MVRCQRCENPAQHLCSVCGEAICIEHSALTITCDRERTRKRRPKVRVRRATPADSEALGRIEDQAIWEHVRPASYAPSGSAFRAGKQIPAENLVAEVEKRAVGTVEFTRGIDPHEAPAILVTDLAVLPEYQGTGVGRALLEAVKSIGRNDGVSALYVSTTIDNIPALIFHLKNGARPFHVREGRGSRRGRWGIPTRFDLALLYDLR